MLLKLLIKCLFQKWDVFVNDVKTKISIKQYHATNSSDIFDSQVWLKPNIPNFKASGPSKYQTLLFLIFKIFKNFKIKIFGRATRMSSSKYSHQIYFKNNEMWFVTVFLSTVEFWPLVLKTYAVDIFFIHEIIHVYIRGPTDEGLL